MKTLGVLIYILWIFNRANGQEVISFKSSDGDTLFYTKFGKGPIVIFLSGGPGFGPNYMIPWADTLSKNFECIVFDQRGTGLSNRAKLDKTTVNLQRAVLDIEDLRKHLGKESVLLCGHSWGGALAQAYAAYYPENVKKMVLVSTLGPDLSLMWAFMDNINMRTYPNEKDSLNYWNKQPVNENTKFKKAVFSLLPYFFDHRKGYTLLTQVLPKLDNNTKMGDLMWADMYKAYDLKPRLINYKGHCIIIKPRQDVMPEETSIQIKGLLPQTKFLVIEQCGHFPDIERPKAFYPVLNKAFLDY
jgi:proline iminopeptidase